MDKYFNSRRFGLIIKNEVVSDYKSWFTYFITVICVYTGISIIEGITYKFSGSIPGSENLFGLFYGFLFLGGFIATAQVFSDTNDKFESALWFTLPGSALEKYITSVLISGVGYIVFICVAFFSASVVSNIFTQIIFGFSKAFFNPFTTNAIGAVTLYYLLTHSIFILGSIVFKKAAFIKTVLAAGVIQLSIFVILAAIGWFLGKIGFFDYSNWDLNFSDFAFFSNIENPGKFFMNLSYLILALLSLFINIVGYFKLREKEVSGGV